MSAETHAALADAIRAHVADESDGSYLTDWVLISAAAIPADPDSTSYVTASSDGPVHHRIGLVRYLLCRTERLIGEDDD